MTGNHPKRLSIPRGQSGGLLESSDYRYISYICQITKTHVTPGFIITVFIYIIFAEGEKNGHIYNRFK